MSAPGWFQRASVMGGAPDDPFWREEDQELAPGFNEWLGGDDGQALDDEDDWGKVR